MSPARLVVALIGLLGSLAALAGILLIQDPPAPVSALAPGEAVSQMAALKARLASSQAVSVTLGPDGIAVELQNQSRPQVSDEWSVEHLRGLYGLFDWIRVSGPDPVSSGQGLVPVSDRVFDLASIDFGIIPALSEAAIRRVALEEPGGVSKIALNKIQVLVPTAHAGALRWDISVAAAHESAAAYADPAGHITGVDLTQTLRAQRLDLYADNKALVDMAQGIDKAFDGKAGIDRLLVYNKLINFHLATGQPAPRQDNYLCDVNGVRHDTLMDEAGMKAGVMPEDQPFGVKEVDWTSLPRQLGRARATLDMPDGHLTLLKLGKRAVGLDAPALQWEIDLQDSAGAKGTVVLNAAGNPVKSPRSENQAKPGSMLEPTAIAGFFDALRFKLDPLTKFMTVTVTAKDGRVVLRQPRDTANILYSLHYDGVALEKDLMPPEQPGRFMGMPFDEEWLFPLGALDNAIVKDLPAREAAALQRLKIPGGKVTDIVFGRQRLMFPANRELVVEIDVAGDNRVDGRVYFDLRGNVMRADGP